MAIKEDYYKEGKYNYKGQVLDDNIIGKNSRLRVKTQWDKTIHDKVVVVSIRPDRLVSFLKHSRITTDIKDSKGNTIDPYADRVIPKDVWDREVVPKLTKYSSDMAFFKNAFWYTKEGMEKRKEIIVDNLDKALQHWIPNENYLDDDGNLIPIEYTKSEQAMVNQIRDDYEYIKANFDDLTEEEKTRLIEQHRDVVTQIFKYDNKIVEDISVEDSYSRVHALRLRVEKFMNEKLYADTHNPKYYQRIMKLDEEIVEFATTKRLKLPSKK